MENELSGIIVGFIKEDGLSKLVIQLTHGNLSIPLNKEIKITWE
jgi:hypothetical protein